MQIVEVKTKKKVKVEINRLVQPLTDLETINTDFSFNWALEKKNEISGLSTLNDGRIIGLMSLRNIKEELRIHIELIESSLPNRGKDKRFRNIPHCLISYAAKQSFALGYDGFVSLYPKTELIKYYKNEYGFEQFGSQLAIYGQTSYELVQKFLK